MQFGLEEIKARVARPGAFFEYAGPLDQERLADLGEQLRDRLRERGVADPQILALFAVLVEQGQNIIRYGASTPGDGRPWCGLAVSGGPERFEVVGGNLLNEEQVPPLKVKLERLSFLDRAGLKELYQQERRRNRDRRAKSTGLGLLEMSRRAAGPLDFRFEPAGPGRCFFWLCVSLGPRPDTDPIEGNGMIEPLLLEAGKYTPAVRFDPLKGVLELVGESYPENTAQFYAPLFDWIERYIGALKPGERLEVVLELSYFNSSSSKALMDLFDRLIKAKKRGLAPVVRWLHDPHNPSAKENGEEFAEDLVELDFRVEEKVY